MCFDYEPPRYDQKGMMPLHGDDIYLMDASGGCPIELCETADAVYYFLKWMEAKRQSRQRLVKQRRG